MIKINMPEKATISMINASKTALITLSNPSTSTANTHDTVSTVIRLVDASTGELLYREDVDSSIFGTGVYEDVRQAYVVGRGRGYDVFVVD